jgi:hypothetical protein
MAALQWQFLESPEGLALLRGCWSAAHLIFVQAQRLRNS